MQGERLSATDEVTEARRRRFSRRRLVGGVAGLTTAVAFLHACGGAPAAAPTTAPKPAEATKPAAAPTTAAAASQPTTVAAAAGQVEVRFATDWVSGVRGETTKVA